jgi:hypothetical protein
MLSVNIDLSEVQELLGLQEALTKEAKGAGADLAKMIHAKALELAAKKLHSRRQEFVENLTYHEVEDGIWVISLAAKARHIDDGMPAHNMLNGLLASPKAKRAKDGSRYIIIPFKHGPGAGKTTTTPAQQDLISTVKSAMRQRGIPFGKLEVDSAGKAKVGKLHSFDIMNAPKKTANGPGQGHGKIGEVKQGNTGIPFLQGVTVYQKKGAGGKVQKAIMTFRTASSKQTGKWNHPGNKPVHIMEEAAAWALETWSKEIAPSILDKVVLDIT